MTFINIQSIYLKIFFVKLIASSKKPNKTTIVHVYVYFAQNKDFSNYKSAKNIKVLQIFKYFAKDMYGTGYIYIKSR